MQAREAEAGLRAELAAARNLAEGASAAEEALRSEHNQEVSALRAAIEAADEAARNKLALAAIDARRHSDARATDSHGRNGEATRTAAAATSGCGGCGWSGS